MLSLKLSYSPEVFTGKSSSGPSSEPKRRRSVLGPRESHWSEETFWEESCFEMWRRSVSAASLSTTLDLISFIYSRQTDYLNIWGLSLGRDTYVMN